jgi:hypothetical protein
MEQALNYYNDLIESLEVYGSPDNGIGAWQGDETELANARLDDMMIRMDLKKTGKSKVQKVLSKYK